MSPNRDRGEEEGVVVDLESDAALSALVDGELSEADERALRARIATDPALAHRFARFEALNRALRSDGAGSADFDVDRMSASLASRLANADDDADASLEHAAGPLEESPPDFGAFEPAPATVVEIGRARPALRVALAAAAAIAALWLATLVLGRPGAERGPSMDPSPGLEGGLLAEETRPEVAPIPDPSDLQESPRPKAPGSSEAPAPRPEAVDPARVARRAEAPEPSRPEPGASDAEDELELYAVALDEAVVGDDFDVIDNLEILELMAALEAEDTRG